MFGKLAGAFGGMAGAFGKGGGMKKPGGSVLGGGLLKPRGPMLSGGGRAMGGDTNQKMGGSRLMSQIGRKISGPR